jgi:hypothetical protein
MKNTATQYTSTRRITGYNFAGLRVGQWISIDDQRGQYLGTTAAGSVVIRWQQADGRTFSKRDAQANKPLRAFAKRYGSK